MKHFRHFIGGLAFAFLGSGAHAATVTSFSSNFEEDAASATTLNFNSFTNWDVTSGTVDLIKSGDFSIICPGTCVDTDGSTAQAGTIETKDSLAAGTYRVSFDISGNQRGGPSDTLTLLFGGFSEAFTLNAFDPFITIVRSITIGADSKVSFAAAGGDNIGIILDNVSVAPIPLPAGLPLFATALGGIWLLGSRRRRSRAI